MFSKYPKIRRLGDDENQGILQGTVTIQEKIDGGNASFYYDPEDNSYVYCSRSGPKGKIHQGNDGFWYPDIKGGFRGLGDWLAKTISTNVNIHNFLVNNPQILIFGEWLVKHTVAYHEYEIFYVYDVYDCNTGKMIVAPYDIKEWATSFGLPSVPVFAILENPTLEEIDSYVGQTQLAVTKGEGVVIKNRDFINRFGRPAYAKRVADPFVEAKTKVKISRDNVAQTIVDKYITEARINKVVEKLRDEKEENPSMQWMGKVLGYVWRDLWEECTFDIIKFVKNDKFQFTEVKKLHDLKVKNIFKEILDKNIS